MQTETSEAATSPASTELGATGAATRTGATTRTATATAKPKAKGSARKGATPRATPRTRPRPRHERLRQPAQPAGTPPPPSSRGSVPSTRADILGTAVHAAAELAEIGLSAGARALRNAVARLPRP
jgi:hypothetical protein